MVGASQDSDQRQRLADLQRGPGLAGGEPRNPPFAPQCDYQGSGELTETAAGAGADLAAAAPVAPRLSRLLRFAL